MNTDKIILDACCSVRHWWFNKNHPNALYIDIRQEPKGFMKVRPHNQIKPDIVMDFRKMDFPDKMFKLVVWDPPHLKYLNKTSDFYRKWGILDSETWPQDLKDGFRECWRVLDDYGTLVFKWSENQIKLRTVLKLFPEKPIIGTTTGLKNMTKWVIFLKIPELYKEQEEAKNEIDIIR